MGRTSKIALRGFLCLLLLLLVGGFAFYRKPLWVNDQIVRYRLWREGVQSKYVQVDGYRIHYFEADSPDRNGTPLVLIHGIGARGEAWAPDIAALAAQGYHVYVPDLLGYGRSPHPDVDYAISLEEKTVYDFMDALAIRHADIAGWSMGGWIALRLTLDHPDRVRRLVVYDSAGIYFHPEFDGSLFAPDDAAGFATLRHTLSPIDTKLPGFAVNAALGFLAENRWIIQRSFDAMENGRDLVDFRLKDLHTPTLIVWGSVDQLIPLSVGQQMHQQIPNSSMVTLTGCGHLAPAECPVPTVKATVDFLKSEQPPAGTSVVVDGATGSRPE